MPRRLAPDEKALWGRVIATVQPLQSGGSGSVVMLDQKPVAPAKAGAAVNPVQTSHGPRLRGGDVKPTPRQNTLDGTWDRRFHKGAVVPDISIDLHGQGLASAHARLDRALDQAVHQKLRVILLVTGKPRTHDRASGQGRGAIAAVVRDWLASSRHASHISAVRQAHPRHGGDGALYIVLKR